MSGDAWDPALYARFRAERRQPFDDLLALVRPRPGLRVVDLGCGPGELTRELHERLGAAETTGVDLSPAMIEQAARHAGPGLRFERGDLRDPPPGPWDVVFSNAALHWVDDHERLVAHLAALLAPGGQLAIQVPANEDHPSHRVAREVAVEPPFAAALPGGPRRSPVLAPVAYAELLDRLGLAAQSVRLQIYAHRLPSAAAVVEWVRGTLLTDYLGRLPEPLHAPFLARYRERLLAEISGAPYLYTYPRILLWAARDGATARR